MTAFAQNGNRRQNEDINAGSTAEPLADNHIISREDSESSATDTEATASDTDTDEVSKRDMQAQKNKIMQIRMVFKKTTANVANDQPTVNELPQTETSTEYIPDIEDASEPGERITCEIIAKLVYILCKIAAYLQESLGISNRTVP